MTNHDAITEATERASENLEEAVKNSVPPHLRDVTEDALGFAVRTARERPILALCGAVLIGYVVARLTS